MDNRFSASRFQQHKKYQNIYAFEQQFFLPDSKQNVNSCIESNNKKDA